MLALEPFPRAAHRLPTHWRLSLWVLRPRALAALLRWTGAVLSGPERAALKALQEPSKPVTGYQPARLAAARRRLPAGRKAAEPPWMAHPPELAWRAATCLGLLILMAMVLTPTSNAQQCLLGGALLAVAGLCASAPRGSDDRSQVLLLMGISVLLAGRYAWWRVTQTLQFNGAAETVIGLLLLMAEVYYWLVLLLSHAQAAWPLRRAKAPVHRPAAELPHVDVFIPTYNEPLHVVRPTLLAAQNLDWPADKLHIHLLDDGRRDEFAAFARAVGVNYVRRTDNRHAKAGNINHALGRTSGEFVAIFDCDHIPVRDFLRATMGWLVDKPDCAMVQTPHHLFSQDPMERNTRLERGIPNEGKLFYGPVQSGNDLWNATFFCGSCAVLRRSALEAIGGIAVETVTEDAHTALKLHRLGYTTTYLPRILAAGLATESLAGHIGQRIRWARGMAQIFRLDNPLRGKGLTLMQRLCYCNAMLHFFNGLPRLILLTAPIAYLVFGLQLLDAAVPTLMAYLLPHLLMGKIFEKRVMGPFRASSWGSVYETVLAWYIMRPTLVALIAPRLGRFNVTAKGGRIEHEFFDWHIATPYVVLISVNLLALLFGVASLMESARLDSTAVFLNMGWAVFNLLLLGVAVRVATETRQVRSAPRIRLAHRLPVRLQVNGASPLHASLVDFSLEGVGLEILAALPCQPGQACHVHLHDGRAWHAFPATISRVRGTSLGVQIDPLDVAEQRKLMACTFSRPDLWRRQSALRHRDRPGWELWQLLRTGVNGYLHVLMLVLRDAKHRIVNRWNRESAP
jgi:cellulose synthase (UDP-forming)